MLDFLFGTPEKKLQKKYEKIMKDAMEAQRSGNIALFAKLSSEAESLLHKIKKLPKK